MRQLRWGTRPPSAVFDNGPIRPRVPLVGRISGYVWNGQEEKRVPVIYGEIQGVSERKLNYLLNKALSVRITKIELSLQSGATVGSKTPGMPYKDEAP